MKIIKCCICTLVLLSLAIQISFAQSGLPIYWNKTVGGNDLDNFAMLQQTTDGGYILGGTSESVQSGDKSQSGRGLNDYWVVKLDASGNKQWDKTFGGSSYDYLYALQQTSDGGYILAGDSRSGISGDKTQPKSGVDDIWLIKLDAAGNKIWDKTLGGSGSDGTNTILQTADGGYLIGGGSNSPISGDKSQGCMGLNDYWLLKVDSFGNKEWDRTYGGNGDDFLFCLKQTASGNYLMAGYSDSGAGGDKSQVSRGYTDFWVVLADASGNKLWDKTFGGSDQETLTSTWPTLDGGFILGGYSNSPVSGEKSQPVRGTDRDYWVVKLDANGNKQWDKTFGGDKSDYLYALQQTTDGGYILGGGSNSGVGFDKTQGNKNNQNDYWLVKLDAFGNKQWDETIGGFDADELKSLQQTTDGGYILGGVSASDVGGNKTEPSQGGGDYWVVKLGGTLTGLQTPEQPFSVAVFPNPSQGTFHLQLTNVPVPIAEITVTDLLGRVVWEKQLKNASEQPVQKIEVQGTGLYLLQVKTGNQTISRKILVN